MCVDPDARTSSSKIQEPGVQRNDEPRAGNGHGPCIPVGMVPTDSPNDAHMAPMAHSEMRQVNAPMSVAPDARPLLPAAA